MQGGDQLSCKVTQRQNVGAHLALGARRLARTNAGAETHSNNTGDLSAKINPFRILLSWDDSLPAVVHHDSTYSANMALGTKPPKQKAVMTCIAQTSQRGQILEACEASTHQGPLEVH